MVSQPSLWHHDDMTFWMRRQPIPIFFLVNWIGVFVPALAIGSTVSALAFHDRTVTASVLGMSLIALVYSTGVTGGERARRRRLSTSA